MTDFTVFGHSHMLSDYADIIDARGGRIVSLVLNTFEEKPGRVSLADRLLCFPNPPTIVPFDQWKPPKLTSMAYALGFPGAKAAPLLKRLSELGVKNIAVLVHPSAVVSPMAALLHGVVVMANAVVAPHAVVGEHAVVNRGATVGHGANVGPFAFLGPQACVCGYAKVGHNAFVGANATVLEDVSVGENAVVAAGAVVTENVPDGVMVAGVPAVVKKAAQAR